MKSRLNTVLLLILIAIAAMNLAHAQDATPKAPAQPEPLPSCTADEWQTIYNAMDKAMNDLSADIDKAKDWPLGSIAAAFYQERNAYWAAIQEFDFPNCVETYSVAYNVGKAFDDMFAGQVLTAFSVYEKEYGNSSRGEELSSYGKFGVNDAKFIFEDVVPDLYEKYLAN